VPPVKTPFTLSDYIPKGFFGSESSDDDPKEGKVAQCCMVSWADECEEVNIETAPIAQEVDQITLRSGRQLQPLELVGKEKGKEATPDVPRIPVNIKERGEDDVIPSTANSKGITENK